MKVTLALVTVLAVAMTACGGGASKQQALSPQCGAAWDAHLRRDRAETRLANSAAGALAAFRELGARGAQGASQAEINEALARYNAALNKFAKAVTATAGATKPYLDVVLMKPVALRLAGCSLTRDAPLPCRNAFSLIVKMEKLHVHQVALAKEYELIARVFSGLTNTPGGVDLFGNARIVARGECVLGDCAEQAQKLAGTDVSDTAKQQLLLHLLEEAKKIDTKMAPIVKEHNALLKRFDNATKKCNRALKGET